MTWCVIHFHFVLFSFKCLLQLKPYASTPSRIAETTSQQEAQQQNLGLGQPPANRRCAGWVQSRSASQSAAEILGLSQAASSSPGADSVHDAVANELNAYLFDKFTGTDKVLFWQVQLSLMLRDEWVY